MSHLQDDHPKIYQHFQDGLHVVRLSDHYWVVSSSDLIIEQALMRSMKINSDLTRELATMTDLVIINASMLRNE